MGRHSECSVLYTAQTACSHHHVFWKILAIYKEIQDDLTILIQFLKDTTLLKINF